MTDQRLRELGRRFKESGSVEDEATYLRERVRVGELPREPVVLAARLGHEASAMVTGETEIFSDYASLANAIYEEMGKEGILRTNVGCLVQVRPVLQEHDPRFEGENARIYDRVVDDLETSIVRGWSEISDENLGIVTQTSVRQALHCAIYVNNNRPTEYQFAMAWLDGTLQARAYIGEDEPKELSWEFIEQAILANVVPWILGYSDPLLESQRET